MGQVINFFGGELLVNNSWSGSRVTKLNNRAQLFPSGCSDERTSSLHINNVNPNVIIVYLGTNDGAFDADIGNDIHMLVIEDEEYFDFVYDSMPYDTIYGSHPNADGMNTLAMMIRAVAGAEAKQFVR